MMFYTLHVVGITLFVLFYLILFFHFISFCYFILFYCTMMLWVVILRSYDVINLFSLADGIANSYSYYIVTDIMVTGVRCN